MHDEAVGTLQAHAVTLHGLHIIVPRFELAGPTRKAVEELEHCIVGDGIPEMIAIYESVQTIHDDVEEWVQSRKSRVLFATHYPSPMGLSVYDLTISYLARCHSGLPNCSRVNGAPGLTHG